VNARRADRRIAAAALVLLLAPASPGLAQRLDLTISPAVVAIPTADPDTVPVVSSAPVSVQYRVRQNNRQTWLLTVQANGDLESGESTIDISAVSWTAAPSPPFQNGTLSKTTAITVATGAGNVASAATGAITFMLANSWTYDTGLYTQTLVFTLSTP
jgi:hypothetical protein